jgi:hypothetical protein
MTTIMIEGRRIWVKPDWARRGLLVYGCILFLSFKACPQYKEVNNKSQLVRYLTPPYLVGKYAN